MEVGAVKQAFNNEVILLKTKLNQAKIHVIHKLTRKAKTLNEKKAPEHLREKLMRKAMSAVTEVLIIKRIKARDIAKFIITHQGQLTDYLNRPKVDNEKACARLVLHKSLQDKYKSIQNRFGNIPIKDLFMSRQERRKLKKDAKEQQKKKKKKNKGKVINSVGDWDVEDMGIGDEGNVCKKEIGSYDKSSSNEDDDPGEKEITRLGDENESCQSDSENSNEERSKTEEEIETTNRKMIEGKENDDRSEIKGEDGKLINLKQANNVKHVKKSPYLLKSSKEQNFTHIVDFGRENKQIEENKPDMKDKVKENKNKNLKEKLQNRKFKKNEHDSHLEERKVVDPFFITATGENYLSLAEPRQPDEIKEVHKQGNRQERRAAMFGRKFKPRNDFRVNNLGNKFNDGYDSKNSGESSKINRFSNIEDSGRQTKLNDKDYKFSDKNSNYKEPTEEKLHPSWEAKRKMKSMSLLPSQGKKIVFSDG